MLPVDAQSTFSAPDSAAFATATTIPRSLNDPVGLHISSLNHSSRQPTRSTSRRDFTSGVSPSPSEMIGVLSVIGSRSR